jgi:anti-sigma factor RsiW
MIRRYLANRRYMPEHLWTHAHLSEYLDGQLRPDYVARVEAHAGICPNCTRVLATLRRSLRSLRALHGEPAGVADGVIARMREES